MASNIAKTVVATGASSGLGFEVVKQLLGQTQPYKFIIGARDTTRTRAAFDELKFDAGRHSLTVLPLELADLKGVRTFARDALQKVGQEKLDYLFLNAAIATGTEKPDNRGSKWSDAYLVNHLSQHYLIHLLREKLTASKARIVVVSSGAIRLVDDPATLEDIMKDGSGSEFQPVYAATKFTQLLGAHWWRRQLEGQCDVVAVSPGLIPATGLSRSTGWGQGMGNHPDAKSVPEGAESLIRAFTKDDFPANRDQIFLTSWGEWWGADVLEKSLDKNLQDKWAPSLEQIEKEEGLAN